MNTVIIAGNCAKDPVFFGEAERRVAKVTLMIDRPKAKDAEKATADAITVSLFGNNADYLERCEVKKGRNILIQGRYTSGSYTNKDRVKVYTREVTANAFDGIRIFKDGNLKFNKAILCGRLTADPDKRTVGDDTEMASYTIAVDRPFKVKEGEEKITDFIKIAAYGRPATFANNYFKKGDLVLVEGRLRSGSYQHKTTGETIYTLDVTAEDNRFALKKGAGKSEESAETPTAPTDVDETAETAPETEEPKDESSDNDPDFLLSELDDDDELPFN